MLGPGGELLRIGRSIWCAQWAAMVVVSIPGHVPRCEPGRCEQNPMLSLSMNSARCAIPKAEMRPHVCVEPLTHAGSAWCGAVQCSGDGGGGAKYWLEGSEGGVAADVRVRAGVKVRLLVCRHLSKQNSHITHTRPHLAWPPAGTSALRAHWDYS